MIRPDIAEPHVMPRSAADTLQDVPPHVAPGQPESDAVRRDAVIDSWLHDHFDTIALALLVAGLVLRVVVASRSYLNPDEALNYLLIAQRSLWLAYKASLTNAHPPLLYLILYYWHFLGRSELMLRLPSVIVGTAFCWVLYKWIGMIFGRTAGMIGLILAAFSPSLITLSAEVRPYALLLFCMVCALYFLAQALEDNSARKMWYFSIFLYLAILTHYSAAFFTVAVGVYCVAKFSDSFPPWNVVIAWAGGQAGALAIYGLLYVTHVSKIAKNDMSLWANPYDNSFFHLSRGSLLTFTWERTSSVFLFLFEQEYVSEVMLLFFLAGVALLLFKDLGARDSELHSWQLSVLFAAPFIAVWGAAIAGIYPYVGGRHTVFLVPFVIAAVSCVLARIYGRMLWATLLIAILIVVASNTSGKTFEPYIKKENQRRSLMIDAMNHVRQSVLPGDVIMVDLQSSLPITYYLCGQPYIVSVETVRQEFTEFGCNGYSVVSTNYQIWKLTPENFTPQFERMAVRYDLKPGSRVWVFQAGWGANLDTELSWYVLKFRCMTPKSFGENITVIPFVVGPDFSPALPPGSPHLNPLGRCSN